LDLEELEAEGIASLSTFLALTNNPELNGILAQRAVELFRPNTVATISQSALNGRNHLSLAATGVQLAFALQVFLDGWSQALTKNDVQLVEVVLQAESFESQQAELQGYVAAGHLLPLLIKREEHLQIILVAEPWRVGDRITCLLNKASLSKIPPLSQSHSTILPLLEPMPLEPLSRNIS